MEGGYHGGHDAILGQREAEIQPVRRSRKSHAGGFRAPGVLKGTTDATLVAPFSNLPAIERLFAQHPGEIAAVILEPIMMNIAFCMPDDGYLQGTPRDHRAARRAFLIFDEVKTGAKLGARRRLRVFRRQAGHRLLGQVHRRWLFAGRPFAASREIMDVIAQQKMFSRRHLQHQSRGDGPPGLATFREVLTPASYAYIDKIGRRLLEGYRRIIATSSLMGYVDGAGGQRSADVLSANACAITATGITSTKTSGRITGSPWPIAECWRNRTGGTSNGRYRWRIPKRISTATCKCSRRIAPALAQSAAGTAGGSRAH